MTRSFLWRLASLWIFVRFSIFRRLFETDYQSLSRQAQRVVDGSLQDNVWRRSAAPGWFARMLLWGGRYPLRFAALVGGISAVLALAFLPAPVPEWIVIPFPALPAEYNHTSFFGTIWSVQATLVALVYPFVLTFIAVMLQRRAASKIALSVYLLDSAVVPSGASSLLLLAVLTVQYLLLAAAPNSFFLGAAVFNGIWLLVNLALTAYFLAKTIQYVEDEVGQRAYRNLAVSMVLRDELVVSLSKHLLVNAAERLNWHPPASTRGGDTPTVQFIALSRGTRQASRTFEREAILIDVHLGALEWVAKRWLARVPRGVSRPNGRLTRPSLQFRSVLHGVAVGNVELCSIADGPDLTPLEAQVVRRAFIFGKRPRSLVSGDTADMLEEVATEVRSLQEQGRHGASRVAFRRLQDLHTGLLGACHEAADTEGEVSSAAGVQTSPYSWGGENLNRSWLHPYRELIQGSAAQIERDQTLLSSLAHAAASLVAGSELQPPQLIAELFSLPRLIDHSMASWWLKEAQRAGSIANSEGLVLPFPAREDYQKALVTLVGGLSSFRYPHEEKSTSPEIAWAARCRAAKAWAAHVDLSATLLLNAVARGDRTAAEWYCDNLSAWWGNHQYELQYGNHLDYEPGMSEVRLGITELKWTEAQRKLSELSNRPVDVEEGQQVVWYSVRRYWESMRLVVCLLLLQQAEAGSFQKLATLVSARLARHRLFNAGPHAEGIDLSNADEALSLFAEICCGDTKVVSRFDAYCEQRDRWNDTSIAVSGWMYSGSGGDTSVRAKVAALSQLMLAAQPGPRIRWEKTCEVIGRAELDLQSLGQMAYLANSCIATFRKESFRPFLVVASLLSEAFEKDALTPGQRRRPFHGFSTLRREALARREAGLVALPVSASSVDELAKRLSAAMTAADVLQGSHAFCTVRIGTTTNGKAMTATGWKFTKENLTDPPQVEVSDGDLEHLAKRFMNHTAGHVLQQLLIDRGAASIAHANDAELLLNIDAAAKVLHLVGMSPVAIVPPGSNAIAATRPYAWGRPGTPPAPPGIQLSYRSSRHYKFAEGYINDTPVLNSRTPGGETYVIPLEWMESLVLERKPLGVVEVNHAVTGSNEVTLDFSWNASLQEG